MNKRNKRPNLSVVALAIFAAYLALASEGNGQSNTSSPSAQAQQQQGPTSPRATEKKLADPGYYAPSCERPKDHEDADLCEQRRQAQAAEDAVWWARAQTYLAVVGSFAVLCSLIFTGWATLTAAKAVKAAYKSADIAESALRMSERPKLWVDQIGVAKLVVGLPLNVVYRVTNSGRTHAAIVSVLNGYAISTPDRVPASPPYRPRSTRPGIVSAGGAQEMDLTIAEPLTAQEVADIASGRKFLFIYGKIVCRDDFEWTCEVGFGGQHGNFGDGQMVTQFMEQPGYTFIRWHAPAQSPS